MQVVLQELTVVVNDRWSLISSNVPINQFY